MLIAPVQTVLSILLPSPVSLGRDPCKHHLPSGFLSTCPKR